MKVLIVGAGMVGEEKLHFMLKSSPNAQITVVATWIGEKVQEIIDSRIQSTTVYKREVAEDDVIAHDIVIAATNFQTLNHRIWQWAKKHGKIINVADTPDLCDFYMGSIVTRGPLKIAISTNGQSPTFAKRFRQLLEKILPSDTGDLINHLKIIRDRMKGDFDQKVKELNQITKSLID